MKDFKQQINKTGVTGQGHIFSSFELKTGSDLTKAQTQRSRLAEVGKILQTLVGGLLGKGTEPEDRCEKILHTERFNGLVFRLHFPAIF